VMCAYPLLSSMGPHALFIVKGAGSEVSEASLVDGVGVAEREHSCSITIAAAPSRAARLALISCHLCSTRFHTSSTTAFSRATGVTISQR
jgi:hypothetical protein